MNIGIIGSGNIGAALARHFSRLGHAVLIANSRGPESLAALAKETNAKPVTVSEATKNVELLVITIPLKNVSDLPKGFLGGLPESTIVADTCNYYPARDGVIEPIKSGLTESDWVAQRLGRPVIKVFNTILTQSLVDGGRPKGEAGRIALPVAGDDPVTKEKVIALLDTMGFDGLDAGNLQDSWRQQPGTPCYCTDLNLAELPKALASADRDVAPEMALKSFQRIMSLPPEATGQEWVRQARSMWPGLLTR